MKDEKRTAAGLLVALVAGSTMIASCEGIDLVHPGGVGVATAELLSATIELDQMSTVDGVDTYITTAFPNTNFGTGGLEVGVVASRTALLRFDPEIIRSAVGLGNVVLSARLEMFDS
jgi:hypothetical protein